MKNIRDVLKTPKYLVSLIVFVAVIFSGGFFVGRLFIPSEAFVQNIGNKDQTATTTVDFAPFWKAWNIIDQNYVPTNSTSTAKVSDQTRVYGAIEGMVASLGDPYTEFFPPVESKDFNDQITGNFDGIGIEIDVKDGVLTVIAPLKDTPAYRAGIKTGDQIVAINGTPTSSLSIDQSIAMMKGPKGTSVTLTIMRAGLKDPIKVSIVRDVINIPTIDTETKGDVFVIHLYTFTATSPDLFRDALRQFVESGQNKLIIDLRGNPGGYLDAAVDMASWFLPAGKTVVSEDYRNNTQDTVYRSKGYDIFNNNLKLAVLIDGGSASASEILAGALHDNGVATLVGTQSFGKGSVQELVNITPDTSLKVTIARWLTPNGLSISHNGLTPDVVVPLDQAKFLNGDDTQMDKAVQILDSK